MKKKEERKSPLLRKGEGTLFSPLLSKFVRSSITSIDDIKFSVCKDKQADPAVSPAGAQHLPSPLPRRQIIAPRQQNDLILDLEEEEGREEESPTLLLGSTLPLARPTVARPTLWLPTAMNNGAAENRQLPIKRGRRDPAGKHPQYNEQTFEIS